MYEDTIRRICRVLSVAENGVALNTLIIELTKRDVLTALKATRARAAAGLRTSAAHARWEEIGLGDVAPVIERPGNSSRRIWSSRALRPAYQSSPEVAVFAPLPKWCGSI